MRHDSVFWSLGLCGRIVEESSLYEATSAGGEAVDRRLMSSTDLLQQYGDETLGVSDLVSWKTKTLQAPERKGV